MIMPDTALQDTEQWRLDRVGSVGASEIADATRRLKNGSPAASRASLMARKIAERLTGRPVATFQSQAMLDGIEREPLARAAYELHTGLMVRETGVIKHPTIPWTHASPDGLIGDDAVLELKNPQHAAHLEMLLNRQIDPDYRIQVLWQLACSGRSAGHFVSYSPDFPPSMQLYIQLVDRDEGAISGLETEVRAFLAELEDRMAKLREHYGEG